MQILVLNCGSSSVKADAINIKTGERILSMHIDRVQSDAPVLRFSNDDSPLTCPEKGHASVLEFAFPELLKRLRGQLPEGIGHRVVHGGNAFNQAVEITKEVEAAIDANAPNAPLHNPVNLQGIQIAKKYFPKLPHIAVFDTAFHATLPRRAREYALPRNLREKYQLRRYGFHGTSHAFVANRAAEYLSSDVRELRIITCHLGSGCSMAAVEYGRSIETSMGFTPLEGLVMGTRSGDLDPGLMLMIMKKEGLSPEEMDHILNKESGLKGLSNLGNDMRDIIEKSAQGDEDCRMAIQVFAHRVKKYIGAYAAVMGGVDAIVFTGGIGENSSIIRNRICQRFDYLGAFLNEEVNHEVKLSPTNPVADFSASHSRCKLLAVATDEQLSIATQTAALVNKSHQVNTAPPIPIAISARHVHLTQETLEALFGKGHQLTVRKPLSQPGQFAAEETVDLIGPKNTLHKVRILGPVRSKNQVEIARTDEFILGIDAPIRESGKVQGSPGITLVGPKGKVNLKEGLICAWRHIHMTPQDAETFKVKDRDVVEVEILNSERSLVFGDVLIRVSPKYKLEMHIDTDEGNAAEIVPGALGALSATEGKAKLRKRRV